jgi:riboflavin kinase/FMN adenylyltransferase
MRVLRQLAALPPATAACIGAFDGLHLGHQALLRAAAEISPKIALVTFEPHPAQILAPASAPPLLQQPAQRERVAASLGVDTLVLLPFTHATASMSPAAFASEILSHGLRPAAVVVGEDFRFGARRAGDPGLLADLLAPAGITVRVVPVLRDDSADKLGSSAIRAAVAAGELDDLWRSLGRHYAVEGVVVRGAGRGRTLGRPTANLACGDALLPRPGVYAAALVIVDPRSPRYGHVLPAAANLGHNPTFRGDSAPLSLEAHILDEELDEELYGLQVELAFLARLRGEQRFTDGDALRAQIDRDIASARAHHGAEELAKVMRPPPLTP